MEAISKMLFNAPLEANILSMSENMILSSVENKLNLFIGVLTLLICASEITCFFYNVYFHYNVEYIMVFAALIFNNVHAVIIMFHNYSKHSSFKKTVSIIKQNFWPIDRAPSEAQQEIVLDLKIVKYLMVISLGMVLCSPVVYLPYKGVHSNDTLFVMINYVGTSNMWPPLKYCLATLCVVKLFPQGYFMLWYLYTLCYFINHYRYQVTMLKWILFNCTKNLPAQSDGLQIIDDTKCQTIIKMRLNKCIRHHIVLNNYAESVVNFFYYTILWQICSGVMLFTSLLYIFLFHNAANNPVPISVNIIGAYFAAFLYTAYGQLFQEQNDILLDAASASNWHCFDASNRKALLIFMLNLKRQFKIVGMGIISLNFEMFIWFSNKVVGLLSVVSTMEE